MTTVTSPAQAQVSACGNTSNTGNSNGTRPLNPAPTQSSAEHSQNSQPRPHPPRSASLCRSCHCSHAHAVDDGLIAMDAMARLEAVLGGMEHVEHGPAFQTDLERLNTALTGHLEWLDPRNAELRLAADPMLSWSPCCWNASAPMASASSPPAVRAWAPVHPTPPHPSSGF